jgi:hypothetical protein
MVGKLTGRGSGWCGGGGGVEPATEMAVVASGARCRVGFG